MRANVLSDDAIERICIASYPKLVSRAFERLLASRPMDPLVGGRRPAAIANAEGATLVARIAWLRLLSQNVRVRMSPCNDFHVCTLLDAELQPFANIGTRTAGSGAQTLVLTAPTELIAVLAHRVQFDDSGASADWPFYLEDNTGRSLLELGADIEAADAVAHIEAMPPEDYFTDALAASGEPVPVAAVHAVGSAVQRSFAAIAGTVHESALSRGWTTIAHRVRERTPICRAASLHAGYFSADSHDVLVLATRCDASGNALNGARTYRMHFERWNEPPANASWFLYVAPAVTTRITLQRTEPAMTITLGPAPLEDGNRQNWIETLPEPAPLEVRLILCWPSERARSEIWTPPDILPL